MKFSSQLKFQHTPNQEVPDLTPSILQWSPGLLLLLPSVIRAGHPQYHLHMAHTDPWNLPLQTQAQVDPQHGHTNYIFVLLTDAMKVKGKMANSGSCWKHHYFLLWPRVFWTLNIWILKQGLYWVRIIQLLLSSHLSVLCKWQSLLRWHATPCFSRDGNSYAGNINRYQWWSSSASWNTATTSLPWKILTFIHSKVLQRARSDGSAADSHLLLLFNSSMLISIFPIL